MATIKWFSGGSERQQEASALIKTLLIDLQADAHTMPLQTVLRSYEKELKEARSSIPFILSRMNMAIATVLAEQDLLLSKEQSQQLQALRSLSHIKYGY